MDGSREINGTRRRQVKVAEGDDEIGSEWQQKGTPLMQVYRSCQQTSGAVLAAAAAAHTVHAYQDNDLEGWRRSLESPSICCRVPAICFHRNSVAPGLSIVGTDVTARPGSYSVPTSWGRAPLSCDQLRNALASQGYTTFRPAHGLAHSQQTGRQRVGDVGDHKGVIEAWATVTWCSWDPDWRNASTRRV